jgi:phosphatidylserine/phosphatidylglycerophosphate/cardiolipin synthase-like enzyme
MYHKKILRVDDNISMVGSYNYSQQSSKDHHEVALFFDNEEVASDIDDVLETDKTTSNHFKGKEKNALSTCFTSRVYDYFHRNFLSGLMG